jgi:Short C-terminal domain
VPAPPPSAQPQQAYAEPASSPQAPAAPPQPADMGGRLAQLKQLGELLQAGVLTQAEFEQQKARILHS